MEKKYEVFLPRHDNNGQEFDDALFETTLIEIIDRFGAVSFEDERIDGRWIHEGQLYSDQMNRFFVVVHDTPENRRFFIALKKRLKARFRQIEILILATPVEII